MNAVNQAVMLNRTISDQRHLVLNCDRLAKEKIKEKYETKWVFSDGSDLTICCNKFIKINGKFIN